MSTPFLSSEEYDERAHHLYNEGKYDEALAVLRDGLRLYPTAVELHVGVGYARLAREEYAWARRSFEEALVLDPEHEDALAGLGETLLRFGRPDQAVRSFRRILELGYQDDVELMLQVGRALFRDGIIEEAREFFALAVQQAPESAEALALVGYCEHRLGDDAAAIATLRRALSLDEEHAEARVYLGNILYDGGDYEGALYHLERTRPEEHWDELAIWRLIELKKSVRRLDENDPELQPWEARLLELHGEPEALDELLGEIEAAFNAESEREARSQLELFGAMLEQLSDGRRDRVHRVILRDGRPFDGTWDAIVEQMRAASAQFAGRSLQDFMQLEARRGFSLTGRLIPTNDCESFLRGAADAGLLRIVR